MPDVLCRNCNAPLAGMTNILSSPVSHLLGTNKVPHAAECEKIRESIAAVQPLISQLDEDIARVQRVLERIIKEREVLKEYVNEHALLLTPARRVPVDIWSEIFFHCLPQGDDLFASNPDEVPDCLSGRLSPRHPPTLFLQVCSSWRNIALSSPTLWSSIPLHSPYTQVPLSVVQTWLKRSQQAPLTVILTPSSDELFTLLRGPAARAMFEQSHRWRSVRIKLPIYSLPVFSLLKHNLPELKELYIDFDSVFPPRYFDRLQELDIFLDAPKLRRVTIYGPPPFIPAKLELPWEQLTHFSSRRPSQPNSMAAFRILLQSAPHLQEVEWHLSPFGQTVPLALQHSRLRNLSMSIQGDPGFAFDYLFLPSLRELIIDLLFGDIRAYTWSWSSFEPFILQNCRALESFALNSHILRIEEVIPCLEVLPSLLHFSLSTGITYHHAISAPASIEGLLEALSFTAGDTRRSVLLPKMKTITIVCAVPDMRQAMVVNKFVDMIESRWLDNDLARRHSEATNHSDITRIKSASLILHGWSTFSVDPADSDRLRTLRSEGLQVEVDISGTSF